MEIELKILSRFSVKDGEKVFDASTALIIDKSSGQVAIAEQVNGAIVARVDLDAIAITELRDALNQLWPAQ